MAQETRGNWKCTKCGEHAYSKCVSQRTVFPNDQYVTLMGNLMAWKEEGKDLIVHFRKYDKTLPEAMDDFVNLLRGLTDDQVKILLCWHEWEIVSGSCDFGCHKASKEAGNAAN